MCSGLTFSDPIVCTQCVTMASCLNSTHYYLDGRCDQGEEVRCRLCDPPCDANLYVEVVSCGGSEGRNRVCVPKTLCVDASCPAGYYESAQCTDPLGPKICSPCSVSCRAGEYIKVSNLKSIDVLLTFPLTFVPFVN